MIKNTHQHEKGQAIAEFVVCLIAIMAILCGVMIVGQLGNGSIDNLLNAREEADRTAASGVFGEPQGVPVSDIRKGTDQLYFTGDDVETPGTAQYVASVGDDGEIYSFRHESVIDESGKYGEINLGTFPTDLTFNFDVDYFISSHLFLDAADLTSGSSSASLPDAEYEVVSPQMLEFLVGNDTITVSDQIYMPRMPAN